MNLKLYVVSELSKIASLLYSNYKELLVTDKGPLPIQRVYRNLSDIIDWETKSNIGDKVLETKEDLDKVLDAEDYVEIKNYQKPLGSKFKNFSVKGIINQGDKKGEEIKLEIVWGAQKNKFNIYFSNDDHTLYSADSVIEFVSNYVHSKEEDFNIDNFHEEIFNKRKKQIVDGINKIINEDLPYAFFIPLKKEGQYSLSFINEHSSFERLKLVGFDDEKKKEIFSKIENNFEYIKNIIVDLAKEKNFDDKKFNLILKSKKNLHIRVEKNK